MNAFVDTVWINPYMNYQYRIVFVGQKPKKKGLI